MPDTGFEQMAEDVEWYLTEYGGKLPKDHAAIAALGTAGIAEALSGMDRAAFERLYRTAANVRDAVSRIGGAAVPPRTFNSVPAKSAPQRMFDEYKCIGYLLDAKFDYRQLNLDPSVEALVVEYRKELEGPGCTSCRKGRVMAKYRDLFYSALKACNGCP